MIRVILPVIFTVLTAVSANALSLDPPEPIPGFEGRIGPALCEPVSPKVDMIWALLDSDLPLRTMRRRCAQCAVRAKR